MAFTDPEKYPQRRDDGQQQAYQPRKFNYTLRWVLGTFLAVMLILATLTTHVATPTLSKLSKSFKEVRLFVHPRCDETDLSAGNPQRWCK